MLRIELQYSGIQDSRFKVPGKSFPGILNPGSRSIEVQSGVLNFNTRDPGFKIPGKLFPGTLNLES